MSGSEQQQPALHTVHPSRALRTAPDSWDAVGQGLTLAPNRPPHLNLPFTTEGAIYPTVEREWNLNLRRRTVNLRRPERVRNEGSTGPKRLDDTRCKTYEHLGWGVGGKL